MGKLLKKSALTGRVVDIQPQFLLQKNACKYLQISLTTFKREIRKNEVKGYCLGRNKIYYRISDLNEMIENPNPELLPK